MKRIGILLLLLAVLGSLIVATVVYVRRVLPGPEEVRYEIGDAVGELNGVKIDGHVAIVSKVEEGELEIAQQNPGPKGKARVVIGLRSEDGAWRVMSDRALGWLRVSEQ
ncbi:MAG: CHAP domain-containing protein [Verrucomicrobia bacterium]|nr:CHAP domain-containing protein [Verrucomicrobiota bacterium]MDA1005939.1 CHAP domain-containing protein [Verrucomicrobiota bacterium]